MSVQSVELPRYSMFAKTPVHRVNTSTGNVVVFGLLIDAVVPHDTDTVYSVPPGGAGRLDLIANAVYGVPDLWWVIARANSMLDPFTGPTPGQELRIPSRDRLASLGVLNY